jgi:hypothetical protein
MKSKMSPRRFRAIAALLAESTIKEASKVADVGETTIFRWLQDPDFQKAYRDARRRVVEQAIARLQKVSGEAVGALREIMNDPQSPASSRVMAARVTLEMAIKAVELQDLGARVEALEKILENREKKNSAR